MDEGKEEGKKDKEHITPSTETICVFSFICKQNSENHIASCFDRAHFEGFALIIFLLVGIPYSNSTIICKLF